MRTGYFYSLVFALLTSASIAAIAAPAAKPEAGNAPLVLEVSTKAQSGKVNLNQADAPTLQREVSGVGDAKARAVGRMPKRQATSGPRLRSSFAPDLPDTLYRDDISQSSSTSAFSVAARSSSSQLDGA